MDQTEGKRIPLEIVSQELTDKGLFVQVKLPEGFDMKQDISDLSIQLLRSPKQPEGIPPGLKYDPESGTLSGSPTESGIFTFSIPSYYVSDYPNPCVTKQGETFYSRDIPPGMWWDHSKQELFGVPNIPVSEFSANLPKHLYEEFKGG